MSVSIFCLDCERQIELDHNLQIGQRIKCPHCAVELEIINLEPLELDWIYERIDPGAEFNSLLEE